MPFSILANAHMRLTRPLGASGQPGGPWYSHKGGWEAVESCLRAKDNMLLLFENTGESQGNLQAQKVIEYMHVLPSPSSACCMLGRLCQGALATDTLCHAVSSM